MDIISIINTIIGFVAQVPVLGPYLVKVVAIAAFATSVVTVLVTIWHALIAVVVALSKVPGLSSMAAFAEKLKVLDSKEETIVNTWILPILNRLSMLPLPIQK